MSDAAVGGEGASREPLTAAERQGLFLYATSFSWPTAEQVAKSAANVPALAESNFKLAVTPGGIALSASQPQRAAPSKPNADADTAPRRVISEFSAKSELRMLRKFVSLDYGPWVEAMRNGRMIAMVTLTYPKNWQEFAPTAKAAQRHLQLFRARLERATGAVYGLWKREFQRRQAVHFHGFFPLPASIRGEPTPHWISQAWWETVASGCPKHLAAGTGVDWSTGARSVDPVRVARYFGRYSAKGKHFQNVVPELWLQSGGAGRFWGYWNLSVAQASVAISYEDFIAVRRVLRGLDRSKGRTKKIRVRRVDRATGRIYTRSVNRRTPSRSLNQSRLVGGGLFTTNGPEVMTDLGRFIELLAKQRSQTTKGQTT